MKKLLIFVIVAFMLSSCATLDKALLNPLQYEIDYEIGGVVKSSVLAKSYEVMIDKDITQKQSTTFTSLYMYELNGEYYWRILRDKQELNKTLFFPANIHFKIDKVDPNGTIGTVWEGVDVNTDKRYRLMKLSWKGYGGYYYSLSSDKKFIIYSVPNSSIWKH